MKCITRDLAISTYPHDACTHAQVYRSFLSTREVRDIVAGHRNPLSGIDVLRKICNHPHLLDRAEAAGMGREYGNPDSSGKLQVALKVLAHWHAEGHKALLFCQTQQMLDILELRANEHGWRYHRMDGGTNVAVRSRMMDDFNGNKEVFLFLLTTRTGGLGVNLVGADRVMLFDPDW